MIRRSRRFAVCFLALFSICCAGSGENPTEFVTHLYDQYQTNHIPDLLGAAGDTIFTPKLLEKYRTLSKKSADRHGLGWDPLCWCDDSEFPGYAISDVKIKTIVSKPDYAEVDVILKISGFGQGGVLVVKKTSGKWLIDDIQSEEIPSLLKYIDGNLKAKPKK